MNTTENNRLIAEFMGLKPVEVFGSYSISKDHVSVNCKNSDDAMNSFCESTRYHYDWNWLMEVVEKIESLGNDILITSNYIQITYDKGEKFITIKLEGNIKIFAVYNACIEFIKWYNQQKN